MTVAVTNDDDDDDDDDDGGSGLVILGTRLRSQVQASSYYRQNFRSARNKSEACLPKVHADSATPGADLLSIILTVDQAIGVGSSGRKHFALMDYETLNLSTPS